jgi:ferric iron reductase protein FhuF
MLNSSVEKLNNGMQWAIIIPSAVLLLALSALPLSYAHVVWNANNIHAKTGQVAVTAAINTAQFRAQTLSDFIDQQQTLTNSQFSKVNAKLKSVKGEPNKLLDKNTATTINGLTVATESLKNQSTQLIEQQKNIKALQEELAQVKVALNKGSSTTPTQQAFQR